MKTLKEIYRSRRFKELHNSMMQYRCCTVGAIERVSGIRNRTALWRRAYALTKGQPTQVYIDCAMNRCRRLTALRQVRSELRSASV